MKKSAYLLIFSLVFVFAACPPPRPQTVQVEICATSGLLPNEWCPAKEVRTFTVGQQPTIPCQVHRSVKVCSETGWRALACCPDVIEVAGADAPDLYCPRHRRNALASPWLVMEWLDAQSKWQRYSAEEKERFCQRVGEAGLTYLGIFFPGWDDLHPAGSVFPYEREADGRWNLDKPNPAYYANLHEMAAMLGKYHVGFRVDMADQCGWGSYWDCWRNNCNGVLSWKDESAYAFGYWKAAVDRVLAAIGGAEGNIIGLGNELKRPDDDDVTLEWALAWAGPRVDYLVSLGIQKPITFSGGGRTAHKIVGAISDEDGSYPDNSYLAIIEHGISLTIHIPPGFESLEDWLEKDSKFHLKGISDDGTDTAPWSHVPPDKAGTCDQSGGCSANIEESIKLVRLFLQYYREGQIRVYARLSREISFDEGPSFLKEQSLEAFWRVCLDVFGVDVRRSFPDSPLPPAVSGEIKTRPVRTGPNPKLVPRVN